MRRALTLALVLAGSAIPFSEAKAQMRRPPVRRPMPPQGVRPAAAVRPVAPMTFDVEVTLGEAGKVRSSTPPLAFNADGLARKYSAAELQELKGDSPAERKLVGYKSSLAELRVGDSVQVALAMAGGASGQLTGTLTAVEGNTLTVKVTAVPPAGTKPTPRKPLVLAPEQAQAVVVLIVERGEPQSR